MLFRLEKWFSGADRSQLRVSCVCSVEFGTIMLWYYIVDRTTVFNYGAKVSSMAPVFAMYTKHMPVWKHSANCLMTIIGNSG